MSLKHTGLSWSGGGEQRKEKVDNNSRQWNAVVVVFGLAGDVDDDENG